jgi:hypothetical protein
MILVNPAELQDNEGNWRLHPKIQADALVDAVEQLGITDVLKVYRSERYGGLTLIDGHLRKDTFPDVQWPALLLDVTDEEADLILASGDAIAALAEASADKLVELRKRVQPHGDKLSSVLDGLYRKAGAALERVEQLRRSPILDNPQSKAARELQKKLDDPVKVAPSAVASAPGDEEEAIAELLESQQIPQRPDYSEMVEQFEAPDRGKSEGNEKWFYIEYYQDQERWDELCAALAPHFAGQSKHELDPDFFFQAMMTYLTD